MATGFPYSRAIVKIKSTRIEKKSGRQRIEDRYYLSSQDQRTHPRGLDQPEPLPLGGS